MKRRSRKFNPHAYKSNVIFFGILISVATLFFQNCGKIKQISNETTGPSITIGKLTTQDSVQVLDTNSSNSENGPRLFTISKNGSVIAGYFENPDFQTSKCQLSKETNQKLQTYLDTEYICFYESTAQNGEFCTQEFIYPYLITISDNIKYELGKKTSGCSETFELCGANRVLFKSFIESVATELSLSCSQE